MPADSVGVQIPPMIDPKMIELTLYNDIPHLLHPVVTDAKETAAILKWVAVEMDRRYRLLSRNSVRNIEDYNYKLDSGKPIRTLSDDSDEVAERMLYVVILVDELSDLMCSDVKNEIEAALEMLTLDANCPPSSSLGRWFDAVAASYAVTIGAIDCIALMHLDTLSGLREIKICRAYEVDGKRTCFFPSNITKLSQASCVYETVEGWEEEITEVNDFQKLPRGARDYVMLIEELTGKPVTIIGVGPRRGQTIFR